MRKGRAATGIVLIIVGLILAVVFFPLVGCQSAGACAEDLENDFSGLSGIVSGALSKEVKFTGTVIGVWTDDVPGIDVAFDLIGLSVITISELDIDYKILGLFDDTASILVFADNTGLIEGDNVYVNGFAMGNSDLGMVIIIGDSSVSSILNFAVMKDPPDPANVDKVPRPGFYIGAVIAIIGFVIFLSSTAAFTKTSGKQQAQYVGQYPTYQGYQNPQYQQPQPAPRFERRLPKPTPPPPPPVEDIDEQEDEDEETLPTPPPPPPLPMAEKVKEEEELPVAIPSKEPQYPCRTCGQSLTYIDQYQRWYCEYCRRYA